MKIVCTLFDVKTECHSPFGLFKTISEAKRTLVISLRSSPDIPPAQFPDDFSLCSCGTYDETSSENPYKVEPLAIHGSVASIIKEFTPQQNGD